MINDDVSLFQRPDAFFPTFNLLPQFFLQKPQGLKSMKLSLTRVITHTTFLVLLISAFFSQYFLHYFENVGQLGTRQLGTRTTGHQTTAHRTTGHQENWAPDNWAPDNWAPDNRTPEQLGTKTTGHQDNWAPGQLGTRTIGHRTTGLQNNWALSGAQLSDAQLPWCSIILVPNCPVPSCPGAKLSWCPVVRCPVVLVSSCPGAQLYGAQMPGAQLSWCPIVRCPVVRKPLRWLSG